MTDDAKKSPAESASPRHNAQEAAKKKKQPREVGGPEGPEPTRYGDWERKGIASDF